MRKINFLLVIAALLFAASCQKEVGSGADAPTDAESIPADFNWLMTQDMSLTVEAPMVEGAAPAYAVVRVYSSPILSEANLQAKGVTKAGQPFQTQFTMPASSANIYVETILPDGTRSVRMAAVQPIVHVSGVDMTTLAAASRSASIAGLSTRATDEQLGYEKLAMLDKESDFDSRAIIRSTPTQMFDLGASYAPFAAQNYLIPAGARVTGNIDLNGQRSPYTHPILYVAGELVMSRLTVGNATLAVLPGGKVTIDDFATSNAQGKNVVYIFAQGEMNAESATFTAHSAVNEGVLFVSESMKVVQGTKFYNADGARLTVEGTGNHNNKGLEITNNSELHNGGDIEVKNLWMNTSGELRNYPNAKVVVTEECEMSNRSVIRQNGLAHFAKLNLQGGGYVYVNCYTIADVLEGTQGEINFGAGAGLDAGDVYLQQTNINMAAGSIFNLATLNQDNKGNNSVIKSLARDNDLQAVVNISEKAISNKGRQTTFTGRMEVVYDNDASAKYQIIKQSLENGAVMRAQQTVVIPSTECNGNKQPVQPEPEPEPEAYEWKQGADYTYCFEDRWPYVGDYDMNDVVVAIRVDRLVSSNGQKVKSMVINWEPLAAGASVVNAFALQMDRIAATQIQDLVSTHSGFKGGIFAVQGLEAGNQKAVFPFYNSKDEVMAASNTWPGQHSPTTKFTTTITFTQDVAIGDVVESAMNFYIASTERANEIHMPNFSPTVYGKVPATDKGRDPYKFYDATNNRNRNNNMMWGLAIPGTFRYPLEGKDIREAYKFFHAWAVSGGNAHQEWYNEEVDESKIYK